MTARRLKQLEDETWRLKRLVADQALDNAYAGVAFTKENGESCSRSERP